MADELIINNEDMRRRVIDVISVLDLTKRWSVTIKRKTKKRTLNQNALYWKWVGIIADDTGYGSDEMHEVLKEMFLPPRQVNAFGVTKFVRSTKPLTTVEMTAYMDTVYHLASTQGIFLPTPEMMGMEA